MRSSRPVVNARKRRSLLNIAIYLADRGIRCNFIFTGAAAAAGIPGRSAACSSGSPIRRGGHGLAQEERPGCCATTAPPAGRILAVPIRAGTGLAVPGAEQLRSRAAPGSARPGRRGAAMSSAAEPIPREEQPGTRTVVVAGTPLPGRDRPGTGAGPRCCSPTASAPAWRGASRSSTRWTRRSR